MNELEPKNIVAEQEESIPPQAQSIIMMILRFISGRFLLLFLVPIYALVSISFSEGRFVLNSFSVVLLVCFIIFGLFFSRKREKILNAFESHLKNTRYSMRINEEGKREINLKK